MNGVPTNCLTMYDKVFVYCVYNLLLIEGIFSYRCAVDVPGKDILANVTAIEDTDQSLRIISFGDDTAVAVSLQNGDTVGYSYNKEGYYDIYIDSHSAENISTQIWKGYVGNLIIVNQITLQDGLVNQSLCFTIDLVYGTDFNLSFFAPMSEFTTSFMLKNFAVIYVPLTAFPDTREVYDVYLNLSNPLSFTEEVLKIGPLERLDFCLCAYSTQFFDAAFKDPSTPLKTCVTKTTEVIAKVTPKALYEKTQPDMIWTMDKFGPSGTLIPYPVNLQNSTVATLLKQTVDPGLYRLSFTAVFFQTGDIPLENARRKWTDFLYVEFLLPDILAIIEAGAQIEFDQTETHQFDASSSQDPLTFPSVTILPLKTSWECYLTEADDVLIDSYIKNFPISSYFGNIHNCTGLGLPSNDTIFTVAASGFEEVNVWYLVVFTLSRENRSSSAIQAVKPVLGSPLKAKLSCVYNCMANVHRKIAHDDLQLNVLLLDAENINTSQITYRWDIQKWSEVEDIFIALPRIDSLTGLIWQGVNFKKETFEEGAIYKISVCVSAANRRDAVIKEILTVNLLPYAGTCVTDRKIGFATLDFFHIACSNWLDEENRIEKNDMSDKNPILSYAIIQRTENPLRENVISLSTSMESRVTTNVGDPYDNYSSTLLVRIYDLFDNYMETVIHIQSFPYVNLDPGNDTVLTATLSEFLDRVDQAIHVANLIGDPTLAVNIGISAASQIPAVDPPFEEDDRFRSLYDIWKGLMDYQNTSTPMSFSELLNNVIMTPSPSASTIILQEAMEKIVKQIQANLNSTAYRNYERRISQVVDGFRNYVLNKGINKETMVAVIGSTATMVDVLRTLDTGKENGEIYISTVKDTISLLESMIPMVVPTGIENWDSVTDLVDARHKYDYLLSLADNSTMAKVENAKISPNERSYLYLKSQQVLNMKFAENIELITSLRGTLLDALDLAASTTNVCLHCSQTFGSNIINSKLITRPSQDMKDIFIDVLNSRVHVELQDDGQNETTPVTVLVAGFQPRHSLFVTETDRTSGILNSELIYININTKNSLGGHTLVVEQTTVEVVPELVHPQINPEDVSQLSYHKVLYRNKKDYLCIYTTSAYNVDISHEVYMKISAPPTILDYDAKREIPKDKTHICLQSEEFKGHEGIVHFGLGRFLLANTINSTDYHFVAVTSACISWEENSTLWRHDQCNMEWYPNMRKITCTCENLQDGAVVIENTFYVPVNTIHFPTVFLKFSPYDQAAVISMLVSSAVAFSLLMIWAAREDKKDFLRWGITVLVDNFRSDTYFYVLKVYTGLRYNAGSNSRVKFVLAGERGDTGVRDLYDGVRKGFLTGSVMNFLMSVPRSLGDLQYIHVWQEPESDGKHSAWYLSKIVLHDLLRNKCYTFLCEDWISVDKEPPSSIIPVSGPEEHFTFGKRLAFYARENLSDNHICTSVVYRPTPSLFSRAERAACTLFFILMSMLTNAMYYNVGRGYEDQNVVKVGPFSFQTKQIYVSLVSSFINLLAVLVPVYLFKRTRRNISSDKHKIDASQEASCPSRFSFFNKLSSCLKKKFPVFDKLFQSDDKEISMLEDRLFKNGYPEVSGHMLPYWFIYVIWVLLGAGCVSCAFFLLLYSMEWGKQKSETWLATFLLSFVEFLFFLDPIKLMLLSCAYALICRSEKKTETIMERSERKIFIQNYHRCCTGYPVRSGKSGPTMTPEALEHARKIKRREEMIQNKMVHIVFNLLFLWMIYSLCYTNSDSRSINLYRDISNKLLTPIKRRQFEQIRTAPDFLDWLEQTAVPTLFPEQAINGMNLHWRAKEFMEGYASYRLGPPRLRQVRCREETDVEDMRLSKTLTQYFNIVDDAVASGKVIHISHHVYAARSCPGLTGNSYSCYSTYDMTEEEDKEYCIGWKNPPCQRTETVYNFSAEAWRYMSSSAIDGIAINGLYNFYGGGGYVASLDVNREVSFRIINEIRKTNWIDRQTRAIFFEFTLYCTNLNIFIYNMFLVEFPETGGAITFYDIVPLRLDLHFGLQGIYTLVCELIYIVVLAALGIYVTGRCYKLKKKALKEPDTMLDLVWVIVSIIALIMYFNRMFMTNEAIAKFNSDKRRFVNFYNIAVWNKVFQVCIGILVFIATVRFLYIMGYNKRIHGIILVFERCGHDLLWFGIFFFYLLLIYAVFGLLLFGSRLESYMNIYRSLGTLFISMIGKSRFTEINETDPVMAKIYLMLMIVFLMYVVLTMFLAILETSIEWVQQQTKSDRSDEVVDFIINRFKMMLGKFKRKAWDEGESDFRLSMQNLTSGQMCTDSIQSQKSAESYGPKATSWARKKLGSLRLEIE